MSTPKKTENNVPTTRPTQKAWHDRAAGDLSTWAEGYNPSSERAAARWNAHRAELEPRISAAPAAGVTEARRIASAVLELVAWAMPLANDIDEALSEDSLQRFIRANPTGLGDGALGNVRGRVRRVLKTRAVANDAPSSDKATSGVEDVDTEDPHPSIPDESGPTDAAALVFADETWAVLELAGETDAVLAASLIGPDDVSASEWAHARAAATGLGVNLTKSQVRRTQHVHALSHPMRQPLGATLHSLGATRRTATEVASLLPTVDDAVYRELLRAEKEPVAGSRSDEAAAGDDCTKAPRRHGDEHLDATTDVEVPVHPTPGGSFHSVRHPPAHVTGARPPRAQQECSSCRAPSPQAVCAPDAARTCHSQG